MAKAKDVVRAVGEELGLSPPTKSDTSYGFCDGLLLQLTPVKKEGKTAHIAVLVNYLDDTQDDLVRTAVLAPGGPVAVGVKAKHVEVKDGVVAYRHQPSALTGGFSVDKLRAAVGALVQSIREVVPPIKGDCRACGGTDGAGAIMVEGVVTCLCPKCLDELQAAAAAAKAEYDARPVRIVPAVVAAVTMAAAGALAWAWIAIMTQRMFWLLAIGIGVAIGAVTARAAGKGSRLVQGLAVGATVVSVLLGNVLIYAFGLMQAAAPEGESVNWAQFLLHVHEMLIADGANTLFALGGGLVGAYYAAKATAQPELDVAIE